MAKRIRRAIDIDQATQMLLAEADVAAMRPALAVAPELVIQTLTRKRRTVTAAKKKTVRKTAAQARKAAPGKKTTGKKTTGKRTTGKKAKTAKKTRKTNKAARKK